MDKPPLEIRILLIEPEEDLAKSLKADHIAQGGKAETATPQPVWGSSLRECQRFLSDRDFTYIGVFINPKVGHANWIACVKSVHQYRPGVPAYILYDQPPKVTADQIRQIGIQGFMQFPVTYADILKVLRGEVEPPSSFDPSHLIQTPARPKPESPEISLKDSDLIAVDLRNRVRSTTSLFDLYLKLTTGRYVQILKANDKLTQDRLDKYRERGADALYIPKTQQEAYLDFCDQLVADSLSNSSLPMSQKIDEISRYGAESLEFLNRAGFSPSALARAKKYVSKVTEAVGQISQGSPEIKRWMENVITLEHSLGVATIAGIMLKNIGVIRPETYESVGIACFLHDIGLFGQSPDLLHEDESKMNAEQKKIFAEHPTIGGQLLAKEKLIPPGVAKAVEQHHLRVNGGFPASKGVQDLSMVAEIIGISEDFCRQMQKATTDSTFDPIAAITEIAKRNYSKTLSAGFLRTLREKK